MTSPKLAAEAWEALFRAQVTLMRRFADEEIWHPISMREYDVLFTLSGCPGAGLRLNELNRQVLMSQPSLSRMVERLEAAGLVARQTVDADKRGTVVQLTDAGARLQKRIGRRHVQSIAKYLTSALGEDDLQSLRRLCTTLRLAQEDIR